MDPAEIRFLLANLSSGQCAVDIGAHKGAYTYWMHKRVGAQGQVFAFEPQPALAQYLKQLGLPQVVVEQLALSSVAGEGLLTVPGGGPSPGATLEADLHRGETHAATVSLTTLDDYFGPRPDVRIDLIKCDVEGHELEVFRGGEKLLKSQAPMLLFEAEQRHRRSDSVRDVFDYLEGLGYRGTYFLGGKRHPVERFDVALHQNRGSGIYVNNFIFTVEEPVS